MEKQIITNLTKNFEDYAHQDNEVEFWFARDLQQLLGYVEWRKFLGVIEKAKEACKSSGNNILDHFVDADKKVQLGSGAEREVEDMMLTRYASYLIAQNGDSRKEEIAFAQTYFALQTRKQEIIEERLALIERLEARKKLAESETKLSKIIYERGVDSNGFARIRSKGDQALFGGYSTAQMKRKLSVPESRPLADFLPTITIKAKDLAAEITHFNVKKDDLTGEQKITGEHVKNNKEIRTLLKKRGISPEKLPSEEDINQLERKVKNNEKQIAASSRKIK